MTVLDHRFMMFHGWLQAWVNCRGRGEWTTISRRSCINGKQMNIEWLLYCYCLLHICCFPDICIYDIYICIYDIYAYMIYIHIWYICIYIYTYVYIYMIVDDPRQAPVRRNTNSERHLSTPKTLLSLEQLHEIPNWHRVCWNVDLIFLAWRSRHAGIKIRNWTPGLAVKFDHCLQGARHIIPAHCTEHVFNAPVAHRSMKSWEKSRQNFMKTISRPFFGRVFYCNKLINLITDASATGNAPGCWMDHPKLAHTSSDITALVPCSFWSLIVKFGVSNWPSYNPIESNRIQ